MPCHFHSCFVPGGCWASFRGGTSATPGAARGSAAIWPLGELLPTWLLSSLVRSRGLGQGPREGLAQIHSHVCPGLGQRGDRKDRGKVSSRASMCTHVPLSHTAPTVRGGVQTGTGFGATRRARPRGVRGRGLRGREPRKPVQRGGKKKGGRCEEAVRQMGTKDGQEGWGSPAPDPHLHCPARQAGPTTRLPLCCTPFSWHVLLFVCNMLMSCTRQELRGQSRLTLKSGKNKAVEGKFAFSETGAPQGLEPAGILQEHALPLSGPRPRLCPGRPLTWSRPAPLSPRGPQLEHISLGHCLRGPV